MRRLACSLFSVLMSVGLSTTALAQEVEPNGSCAKAQDLGRLEGVRTLHGSLDAVDAEPVTDVDYFRITATPGTRISIRSRSERTLRSATFDDRCIRRSLGISNGGETTVGVPESGVVFFAKGDEQDVRLDGNGVDNPGAYEIVLSELVDIGSISGRVLDAETGEPRFLAMVDLEECFDFGCIFMATAIWTDENGAFRFEAGLSPGTFRLVARDFFGGYADTTTVRFKVGAGEHVDLGEIFLVPETQCSAPLAR